MTGDRRTGSKGQVLLINPWIYDFAAHNLWIEPLGLLTIASALRASGYTVTVLDCLAPHPGVPVSRDDGSGRFFKTVLDRPPAVAFVPRRFGRYGWPLELFEAALAEVPQPDAVLVTSGMTYWYPGVLKAIDCVRSRHGRVPIGLGGVYATLCHEHARQQAGADLVVAGPGVVAALRLIDDVTGHNSEPQRYTEPSAWSAPDHDLVARPFSGLVTSWGCPYRCTYCASHRLQPAFVQREAGAVVEEIAGCVQRGIQDFAFYDDALLAGGGRQLAAILRGTLSRGLQVRFHTPNGLHARGITPDLAKLMRIAGVTTIRLSLETIEPARQRSTGDKVSTGDFARAVSYLRSAGYGPKELGAYILAGLPDQPLAEVQDTVNYVHGLGVQAKLALFSPIPGTPDGDRALAADGDPLLHNNTVYPYLRGPGYAHLLQQIKQLAKDGNAALLDGP